MTTVPLKEDKAVMGSDKRARLLGSSRSKYPMELGGTISLASVVFPDCRGPTRSVTGLRLRAARIAARL
jgi:hypothetical protein